ncbi:hypothetical protein [Sandaracinus amylolyticus]|uniref:hypothetical protein n=1 Tax=Sandaracinus amylolyticus TaxID=927083 RepID=UPI001F296C0F|nr:hypothetical protein [Sandaracinus amylolyticus]
MASLFFSRPGFPFPDAVSISLLLRLSSSLSSAANFLPPFAIPADAAVFAALGFVLPSATTLDPSRDDFADPSFAVATSFEPPVASLEVTVAFEDTGVFGGVEEARPVPFEAARDVPLRARLVTGSPRGGSSWSTSRFGVASLAGFGS